MELNHMPLLCSFHPLTLPQRQTIVYYKPTARFQWKRAVGLERDCECPIAPTMFEMSKSV